MSIPKTCLFQVLWKENNLFGVGNYSEYNMLL